MSPVFRPRRALPADAAAILKFNRLIAEEAPQFLAYEVSVATGAEMLGARLGELVLDEGGDGVLVLADEARGAVADVLLLRRHRHPAFEGVPQLSIAVAPEWRGIGAGRLFLEHAIREARSAGARRLQLAAVAGNEAAVGLFRGAGFAEEGRLSEAAEIAGRLHDVLVMARAL